jgi:enoyl-CoA hydratase/carnithine racemase
VAEQPEIPPPSLDDVLYESKGDYGVITLNRPVVLNAVNWSISRRLWAALDSAEADDDAKSIILTGAGRAFCAGGDIQSKPPPDDDPVPSGMDIVQRIWNSEKPVIAAVRGYAVGQGCEIAGMCDLTIAADDAVFGELQIRHGFGPPFLITPFLVGLKQAKEILMLGERIDAEEAKRLGLVNRVVPVDKLMEEAEKVAKRIASLPQATVRMNKKLVNRAYELAGFQEALAYRSDEALAPLLSGDTRSSEHLKVLEEQGWDAFRKSRDAAFTGAADQTIRGKDPES